MYPRSKANKQSTQAQLDNYMDQFYSNSTLEAHNVAPASPRPGTKADNQSGDKEDPASSQTFDATPNLKLEAIPSFTHFGLQPWLCDALSAFEHEQPSAIQQRVLPLFLAGRDCLVQHSQQPCTGKTTACIVALLHFINWENNAPQAIFLSPTRELARYTFDFVTRLRAHAKVCVPRFSLGPVLRMSNMLVVP